MGTHPIFESDFDCLTDSDTKSRKHGRKEKQHLGQRPFPQGLEKKSQDLVQPTSQKGQKISKQSCKERCCCSSPNWWTSPPSCPLPNSKIQHACQSWQRFHPS